MTEPQTLFDYGRLGINTQAVVKQSAGTMLTAHRSLNRLAVEAIKTDSRTQPRVQLSDELIAEYAEAMADGASFNPIVVFNDGSNLWLADGYHRLHAAKTAHIEKLEAEIYQGSFRDAILYSVGANAAHGLRRSNADKRKAVTTLLEDEEWSQWSNCEIARITGVSDRTVGSIRSELSPKISEIERTATRNGTTYTINTTNIGKPSTLPQELPEEPPLELLQLQNHQLINASSNNEWYTPEVFLTAAKSVMGGIDLDPASNAYANRIVQASEFFTATDDGYTKKWHGRVWLNPPYGFDEGESNQAKWSAKLINEYLDGNVTEALLLVNAVTGNSWFAPLWNYPICFVSKRIRFYNQETIAGQPTHSNAIIYFGNNNQKFVDVFSAFGSVAARLCVTKEGIKIDCHNF